MSRQSKPPCIIHVEKADSTNGYLRALLTKERLPERSLLVAEAQEQGRGQAGNSWESEAGKNLTFSLVIYPKQLVAGEQFILSQLAALSVKATLDYYTDHLFIKWPNDIYHKEHKICGILIENDLVGQQIDCSILGFGININQERFESNAPNPISLYQITHKKQNKEEILQRFISTFEHYYALLSQEHNEEIRHQYTNALYRKKGFHAYSDNTGVFDAEIQTIEPTGHLCLRLRTDEVRRYAFKEVAYVKE